MRVHTMKNILRKLMEFLFFMKLFEIYYTATTRLIDYKYKKYTEKKFIMVKKRFFFKSLLNCQHYYSVENIDKKYIIDVFKYGM